MPVRSASAVLLYLEALLGIFAGQACRTYLKKGDCRKKACRQARAQRANVFCAFLRPSFLKGRAFEMVSSQMQQRVGVRGQQKGIPWRRNNSTSRLSARVQADTSPRFALPNTVSKSVSSNPTNSAVFS